MLRVLRVFINYLYKLIFLSRHEHSSGTRNIGFFFIGISNFGIVNDTFKHTIISFGYLRSVKNRYN